MHHHARFLAAALALVAAPAAALDTVAGEIDLPRGFTAVERSESGRDEGLYVFMNRAAPGAVFMLVATPSPGGAFDGAATAAAICDPEDPTGKRESSGEVAFGDATAARAADTLRTGQASVALATEHAGLRVIVLMKGPPTDATREAMAGFEGALADFDWRRAR
jgi:hypothetical protein